LGAREFKIFFDLRLVDDIIIFRRGNPNRGSIEGVDNENLAFQRGLRLFWPLQWP
jgi:hypothetical protein